MCKNREETVTHIISECSKLSQVENKKRHNKVARAVHWSFCETYHIKRSEQWNQHMAKPVIATKRVKILWYMNTQMDRVMKHR